MDEDKERACSEFFKDVNGQYSAKRGGLFVILALISACTIGGVFFGYPVPDLIFNGLVDLCGWFVAAILGEHAPAALGAFKGFRSLPGLDGEGANTKVTDAGDGSKDPVQNQTNISISTGSGLSKEATIAALDDPDSILNRGKS